MKKYVLPLFSLIFILSSCGRESSSNPYRYSVSSHTVKSVEDYKQRMALRSEAKKEVMEIISENIDLEELDRAVGNDPEFAETFGGNDNGQNPEVSVMSLGGGYSVSEKSELSDFRILDKIAFADNKGRLEGLLKNSGRVFGMRSLSSSGATDISNLKQELGNVFSRFRERDNELKPDMGPVLAVSDDFTEGPDGNLANGDEILDTSSLSGIATAVVMIAKARGEDPEAAINYLREELIRDNEENPPYKMEVVISDETEDDAGDVTPDAETTVAGESLSRSHLYDHPTPDARMVPNSLYVRCAWWNPFYTQGYSCRHWSSGFIRYAFGSSDSKFRNAMGEAMNDWKSKTGGQVRFWRFPDWLADLGFIFGGIVKMELKELGWTSTYGGTSGRASIGYNGFYHFLQIDPNILSHTSILKGTTRHELGHVLGLLHEHQRWDRDAYLDMQGKTGGLDFKKIDLYSKWGFHFLAFERRAWRYRYLSCRRSGWWFRCGWRWGWTYYWVPVWRYHEFRDRTGKGSASFDCDSIMLYPGIKVRGNNCGTRIDRYYNEEKGEYYTGTLANIDISQKDADAAKNIY